jgi:hypothetical protein
MSLIQTGMHYALHALYRAVSLDPCFSRIGLIGLGFALSHVAPSSPTVPAIIGLSSLTCVDTGAGNLPIFA